MENIVSVSAEYNIPDAAALEELLRAKNYHAFRAVSEEIPAVDLAEIIADISPELRTVFFRLLSKEKASEVFVEMDSELTEQMINSFSDKELAELLSELYVDDTVDIIEEMPAGVVKRIIRSSDKETREAINQILRYGKNTAGALMTTEYVRLRPDMTVGQAIDHLRHVAIDKETIYTAYVTDRERHLIGIVTAKKLLLSSYETEIREIMEENIIFVRTTDDREEASGKFTKYGFIALPVVDLEDRLVGIITVDDAMDVIVEEAAEDIAKISAIVPTDETYLKASPIALFKSRIVWLAFLMVSASLSSAILNFFESALPAVLILFVPMLMGTGGNSGAQASAMVIRGISLGEIRSQDIKRVLFKELAVGLLTGLALGAFAFLKVYFVDRLITGNAQITLLVALATAAAMALTILVAKLIGAVLPILAKLVGLDPAVMASPLITTIVDALSLLLYFAMANAIL
ncbi:MAG: magnesium transporter [Clostridia bacterium]|nr:magnesium transporter [Clostridia bacterium]